ncbi:MAG: aspartate aminotransferase family protein [Bacteroidia bacterium]|jgi:acetylornithine/succinyldiaminopimelate/putrescine aminotransferase
MLTQRQLFLRHLAQTSDAPLGIEAVRAEGSCIWDAHGRRYIDLISGIGVSNVGHRHPAVCRAIHEQVDRYMHLMVYGEYIQYPQVQLATRLARLLPESLDQVYLTNSGTEAIEGALKLAKKFTGRGGTVSFEHAYHGSTHGALSIMGHDRYQRPFAPLVPGNRVIPYNHTDSLRYIDHSTAAVVVESVQGEAGYQTPCTPWFQALRARCTEVGAVLICDEIQSGIGRTGDWFGFTKHDVVPDVVTLAKGLGGGLPIGAFVAPGALMSSLKDDPALGHITTFGGNPVCAAAACAVLDVLEAEILPVRAARLEDEIRSRLQHPSILRMTGRGFMLGVDLGSNARCRAVIADCLQKGVITDWFLFNEQSLRIAPPLNIPEEMLFEACDLIRSSIAAHA